MLRAVPGGCKWLVAVAALSSVRVPSPSHGDLRRHDDAFELYASHNFFVLLGKR